MAPSCSSTPSNGWSPRVRVNPRYLVGRDVARLFRGMPQVRQDDPWRGAPSTGNCLQEEPGHRNKKGSVSTYQVLRAHFDNGCRGRLLSQSLHCLEYLSFVVTTSAATIFHPWHRRVHRTRSPAIVYRGIHDFLRWREALHGESPASLLWSLSFSSTCFLPNAPAIEPPWPPTYAMIQRRSSAGCDPDKFLTTPAKIRTELRQRTERASGRHPRRSCLSRCLSPTRMMAV